MEHRLETVTLPIGDLHTHPRNPRSGDVAAIAESLRRNGQYRPIVAARDGAILAGNHTYKAAVQLGWTQIAAVVLDLDADSPEASRIMLADNRTAELGYYDDGLLLQLLEDMPDLEGTGYNPEDVATLSRMLEEIEGQEGDLDDSKYTKVINIPQYEPTSDTPPPHSALYDNSRAKALTKDVKAANLDDATRDFLLAAAQRHIKFTYSQIAEFYAHAEPHVQKLMEDSALVIIDVQDAIRHGYADLEKFLDEHITEDE